MFRTGVSPADEVSRSMTLHVIPASSSYLAVIGTVPYAWFSLVELMAVPRWNIKLSLKEFQIEFKKSSRTDEVLGLQILIQSNKVKNTKAKIANLPSSAILNETISSKYGLYFFFRL